MEVLNVGEYIDDVFSNMIEFICKVQHAEPGSPNEIIPARTAEMRDMFLKFGILLYISEGISENETVSFVKEFYKNSQYAKDSFVKKEGL